MTENPEVASINKKICDESPVSPHIRKKIEKKQKHFVDYRLLARYSQKMRAKSTFKCFECRTKKIAGEFSSCWSSTKRSISWTDTITRTKIVHWTQPNFVRSKQYAKTARITVQGSPNQTNEGTKRKEKKRIQYFQSIHNSFCFSAKENEISELPLSAAVFFFFFHFSSLLPISASLVPLQRRCRSFSRRNLLLRLAALFTGNDKPRSSIVLESVANRWFFYLQQHTHIDIIRTIILFCGCVIRCAHRRCYWSNPCNFCWSIFFLSAYLGNYFQIFAICDQCGIDIVRRRQRRRGKKRLCAVNWWNCKMKDITHEMKFKDDSEKLLLLCRSQCEWSWSVCVWRGFFSSLLLCFITVVFQ